MASRECSDDLAESPESAGTNDLVVIDALREWSCAECTGTGAFLIMEDRGPLCLTCAELDHLVFLPRGDAALTRRARKASVLSAVVVRFSRSRRRYERQGLLVEVQALDRAEEECLADEEARPRRRIREQERRAEQDEDFKAAFAIAILGRFPGCPNDRAQEVAGHAAQTRERTDRSQCCGSGARSRGCPPCRGRFGAARRHRLRQFAHVRCGPQPG